MNLSNEQVQIILDDFVVENADEINEVQSNNPVLYDAVIDALNYISKKFGTQDKLEIPETITKVEEVVEIPTKEEEGRQSTLVVGDIIGSKAGFFEVVAIKNDVINLDKLDIGFGSIQSFVPIESAEQSLSEGSIKKVRRPQRGDVFKSTIGKEYIIRNISTSTNDIEIAWYANNGVQTSNYKIWDVLDNYKDGTFTLISAGNNVNEFLNPTSNTLNYKVGDKFKNVNDTETPPNYIRTITEINTNSYLVKFDILNTKSNKTQTYNQSIRDFEEDLMNRALVPYVESTTIAPTPTTPSTASNTLNYQVGDKFKSGNDTETPPKWVFTITAINQDSVEYSIFNKDFGATDEKELDKNKWEEDLTNGVLVPYVEPTTIASSTPPKPSTASNTLNYQVGDKFKGGKDLGTPPKYIYTITKIDFNSNLVVYEELSTKSNIIEKLSISIIEFEEDLMNRALIPYVEPTTIAPIPPTPSTASNQERIDEILILIDGLQILADIGDDDSINEIKSLKKELKTLKISNK